MADNAETGCRAERDIPLPVVQLVPAGSGLLAESTYSKCSLFPAKRRDRAAWTKPSMR